MVKYWKISQEVIYGTYPKDIDMREDKDEQINREYGIKDGESLILIGRDLIKGNLYERTKPQTEADKKNENYSFEQIRSLVQESYGLNRPGESVNKSPAKVSKPGKVGNISSQINNFTHNIKIGDKIIVSIGQYYFRGIGTVVQEYFEIEKKYKNILTFGNFRQDGNIDDFYFRAIKIKWDNGWMPNKIRNYKRPDGTIWEVYKTPKRMSSWVRTVDSVSEGEYLNIIDKCGGKESISSKNIHGRNKKKI